jgi:2,3-bisphosphoglycerate-independent phosphoglycerate mutase
VNPLLPNRFLFVFLDGVGLGEPAPHNPFTPTAQFEPAPFLRELLGVPLLLSPQRLGDPEIRDQRSEVSQNPNDESQVSHIEISSEPVIIHPSSFILHPSLLLRAIDASLGLPGLPQSATGQTSLYTGRNAPAFMGRHVTGFANGTLRILIEESGMFKQVKELGGTATLANLYTDGYFEAIERRRIRYSVGTLLTMTAELPFRMPEDYAQGLALFWDITGELIHQRENSIKIITPEEGGKRLANIAAQHNLTLFECYMPDFAGHAQDYDQAIVIIQRIDRFLKSLIENLPNDVTLIVSSDHGNVEDLSRKMHTLNPVPLLVYGKNATQFSEVVDIMGIVPVIIQNLNQV